MQHRKLTSSAEADKKKINKMNSMNKILNSAPKLQRWVISLTKSVAILHPDTRCFFLVLRSISHQNTTYVFDEDVYVMLWRI